MALTARRQLISACHQFVSLAFVSCNELTIDRMLPRAVGLAHLPGITSRSVSRTEPNHPLRSTTSFTSDPERNRSRKRIGIVGSFPSRLITASPVRLRGVAKLNRLLTQPK